MSPSLFSQGTIAGLSTFVGTIYTIHNNIIGTRVCLKIGLNFLKFGPAMSTGLEVSSNSLPTLSSALSTN